MATVFLPCALHVGENIEKYSGLNMNFMVPTEQLGASVVPTQMVTVLDRKVSRWSFQYQAVASRCGLPA